MTPLVAIAIGGAMGAVSRYWVMTAVGRWLGLGFPYGTLAVNVIGSVLIGLLIQTPFFAVSASPTLRALIGVGFLGAFTTFSAFSLDVVVLIERGAVFAATVYVAASITLSVLGLLAGIHLMKAIPS